MVGASILATAPDVHRDGNQIVDRVTGKPVSLKGVAMMGGEYMCVHTNSIFAGPANQTVIDGACMDLWQPAFAMRKSVVVHCANPLNLAQHN